MTRLPAAEVHFWPLTKIMQVRLIRHPTADEMRTLCSHLNHALHLAEARLLLLNMLSLTPPLRAPERRQLVDLFVSLGLRGFYPRIALVVPRPVLTTWISSLPTTVEYWSFAWAEFSTTPPAEQWLLSG